MKKVKIIIHRKAKRVLRTAPGFKAVRMKNGDVLLKRKTSP